LSFTGPLDCFKKTLNQEGVRGLYRGITPPIVGAAVENATLFFVYNRCQAAILSMRRPEMRNNPLSLPELALSGAGAGAVTSFVL
jgi:ornithine carrier protein